MTRPKRGAGYLISWVVFRRFNLSGNGVYRDLSHLTSVGAVVSIPKLSCVLTSYHPGGMSYEKFNARSCSVDANLFRSHANPSLNRSSSGLRISTTAGPGQRQGARVVPHYETSDPSVRSAVALSQRDRSRWILDWHEQTLDRLASGWNVGEITAMA